MKVYHGFDANACLDIAKAADNKQIVKDVNYAKFIHFHNPNSIYCEMLDDKSFIIGQVQKNSFRIIGMGTRCSNKRQGLASILLERLIKYCKQQDMTYIHTRSKSGADFYCKRGFDVFGMKGGDYLLKLELK
jgi:hypothetical protein